MDKWPLELGGITGGGGVGLEAEESPGGTPLEIRTKPQLVSPVRGMRAFNYELGTHSP